MTSKLRAHFERCSAHAAAANVDQPAEDNTQYQLQRAQLSQDQRTLKGIKSIDLKIVEKLTMIEKYDAYLDGTLTGNSGAEDDVLTMLLLWQVDCGRYDRALALGKYAVEHGLAMPASQERSVADALAEEMATQYFRRSECEGIDAPSREQLHRTLEIVAQIDMHDEVAAKLHYALGLAMIADNLDNPAVAQLERAIQLNPKIGAKKLLQATKKRIDDGDLSANTATVTKDDNVLPPPAAAQ